MIDFAFLFFWMGPMFVIAVLSYWLGTQRGKSKATKKPVTTVTRRRSVTYHFKD